MSDIEQTLRKRIVFRSRWATFLQISLKNPGRSVSV